MAGHLSPVARELARATDAHPDRTVISASVVHPLVEGPALLAVSWGDDTGGAGPRYEDLPEVTGVRVSIWSRPDDTVALLPPMAEAGRQIVAAAWMWGAWDIAITCIGAGYAGPLPPSWSGIEEGLREQGYVSWTWRPMLAAPALRAKVHGRSDPTLHPITLARHEAPPQITLPPIEANTQRVIQLGIDPNRVARRPQPRATERQRAYIVVLRRGTAEQGAPLPARLTRREASAMIDRLLAERAKSNREEGRP